jgi:hypothetical protein
MSFDFGSGRVRIGLSQFDFLKELDRVGFKFGRVSRVGSGSATTRGGFVSGTKKTNENGELDWSA